MAEKSDPVHRAAIIGLGFVGAGDPVSGDALGQKVDHLDGTHAAALSANPRIHLAAGSSRDEGRRKRFQQRTGTQTYADWRDLLAQERPDIVSVATYAPQHAEITIACAEHGVRVIYCEKPIATRLPDAEHMVAACEKAGALLVINHNRHFNPNYRRLRDFILAGGLGQLTSASVQWGSGRLGNVGTHLFDALAMLTARRIEAASATLDLSGKPDCRGPQFHDPGGWGVLRLSGGLMATFDAPDHAKVPGRLIINGTLGRAITGGEDVAIEFWDGRTEQWPSLRHERTGMDRAVAEIVAWLDDQTPFPCPPGESVHVLEAILACHASHDRNAAWASLPLTGPDRERELLSG